MKYRTSYETDPTWRLELFERYMEWQDSPTIEQRDILKAFKTARIFLDWCDEVNIAFSLIKPWQLYDMHGPAMFEQQLQWMLNRPYWQQRSDEFIAGETVS